MKLFDWKLNSGKNEVCFLGDLHYGAPNCQVSDIKSCIKQIKNRNIQVMLMGDLVENGTRESVGAGVYEQVMHPSQQIKDVISLLHPIKDQIICSMQGNHEERTFKDSGVGISEVIADSLDCNYSNFMSLVRMKNSNLKYDIFGWHGYGSGQSIPGKLKALTKQAEWIDADIYAMGHTHELYHVTDTKRNIDNVGFTDRMRHFILTGSFLKWDGSYAESRGYKPMKIGCPLVTLDGKKHNIEVDLEWFK